jgi:hypothetical protein
MNFKKLSILLSGLVMIFGTTTAFAVWDSLSDSEDGNTINIGSGVNVAASTTVNVADWLAGGQLVPSGAVLKDGDVVAAVNTFTVAYTGGDLADDLFLDVSYDTLLIDGLIANIDLVTIIMEFGYVNSIFNNDFFLDNELNPALEAVPANFYNSGTTRQFIYVRITVLLVAEDGINQEQYDAITEGIITFNLNFLAVVGV